MPLASRSVCVPRCWCASVVCRRAGRCRRHFARIERSGSAEWGKRQGVNLLPHAAWRRQQTHRVHLGAGEQRASRRCACQPAVARASPVRLLLLVRSVNCDLVRGDGIAMTSCALFAGWARSRVARRFVGLPDSHDAWMVSSLGVCRRRRVRVRRDLQVLRTRVAFCALATGRTQHMSSQSPC